METLRWKWTQHGRDPERPGGVSMLTLTTRTMSLALSWTGGAVRIPKHAIAGIGHSSRSASPAAAPPARAPGRRLREGSCLGDTCDGARKRAPVAVGSPGARAAWFCGADFGHGSRPLPACAVRHRATMEATVSDAAICYERLEVRILRGRALGLLPEETEDAILEEMDALWRLMTSEERAAANARLEEARRSRAPVDLKLRDVFLVEHDSRLPREAA